MKFDLSRFGINESNLPANWAVKSLGDIADFNPERISKIYPHSIIQYLDIGNVSTGQIGVPIEVSRSDAPSRAQRMVKDGDTILSTVRPGNRAYAFIQKPPGNLIVSTGFAVLRAKANISQRFLYYLATSTPIIDYLASIAEEKSAYPSVNPSDIAECLVPVPESKHEQDRIAAILGVLDDKIELNRAVSENLADVARAIFKSWFVDFSPVRAKAAGKPARLPKEISDMFPSKFEHSEIGEIPAGWELMELGELIDFVKGKKPSETSELYKERYLPQILIENLDGATPLYAAPEGVVKVEESEPIIVMDGASSGRVEIGFWGALGSTLAKLACHLKEYESGVKFCSEYYVYYFLKSKENELRGNTTGTSIPHLDKGKVCNYKIPVPPISLLSVFATQITPILKKIRQNKQEVRSLSGTRDTLLPELLSGRLKVS